MVAKGVFGIAVGRVWREIEGSLAELPGSAPTDVALSPKVTATNSPSDVHCALADTHVG